MKKLFATLMVVVLGIVGSTAPASAARSTKIPTFAISVMNVTPGQKVALSYKAMGVRPGTTFRLQRKVVGGSWTSIKKVKRAKGEITIRAPRQGKYSYRLVAVRGGKTVARSKVRNIYSYANISLADFLGGGTAAEEVNGVMFRYAAKTSNGWNTTIVNRDATTCRSITLSAVSNYRGDRGTSGGVSIVQERVAARTVTLSQNQVSTFSQAIGKGALKITLLTDWYGVFANGTLSCYTDNGQLAAN